MSDTDLNQEALLGGASPLTEEERSKRDQLIIAQTHEEELILPEYLNYLWMIYANFQVMIVSPFIVAKDPPVLIKPDYDKENQRYEDVYWIVDQGYAFSTSRGEDSALGTVAMGKMYRTIHKMIRLAIQRILEEGGEGAERQEIKVALFGHELPKRKAFALIMDLDLNVNIINFDPRAWGERFINNLKYMITSGHGYPIDLKNVSERIAPPGSLGR